MCCVYITYTLLIGFEESHFGFALFDTYVDISQIIGNENKNEVGDLKSTEEITEYKSFRSYTMN